jgi:hypothetical protein
VVRKAMHILRLLHKAVSESVISSQCSWYPDQHVPTGGNIWEEKYASEWVWRRGLIWRQDKRETETCRKGLAK